MAGGVGGMGGEGGKREKQWESGSLEEERSEWEEREKKVVRLPGVCVGSNGASWERGQNKLEQTNGEWGVGGR